MKRFIWIPLILLIAVPAWAGPEIFLMTKHPTAGGICNEATPWAQQASQDDYWRSDNNGPMDQKIANAGTIQVCRVDIYVNKADTTGETIPFGFYSLANKGGTLHGSINLPDASSGPGWITLNPATPISIPAADFYMDIPLTTGQVRWHSLTISGYTSGYYLYVQGSVQSGSAFAFKIYTIQ